jgi:hypothetical protein
MPVILSDLLLFSCLAAFMTGIVIAVANLLNYTDCHPRVPRGVPAMQRPGRNTALIRRMATNLKKQRFLPSGR